jgi:glycosyltransferase involved in cell wall biosynthesis
MKANPKISVIMAVYNTEEYLEEAIRSILNQTFKNFEFIIINDKSTDNSLNIIKKYIKIDKRIILINNDKNIGRTASRNKGLKIAKGEYIAIMDSDDVSLQKRFEIQYKFLENNKPIFLIGGGVICINEQGREINQLLPLTNFNKIKKVITKKNCFYHPTIMFRNSRKIFYRDKFSSAEDYDFYLLLLTQGKKISNIGNILVRYRKRKRPNSLLNNVRGDLFTEKAKELYFERAKLKKDKYNQFHPEDILNLTLNKVSNPHILKIIILSSIQEKDLKNIKKFSKKYLSQVGFSLVVLFYFLIGIFGSNFIDLSRKLYCLVIYKTLK